jgi:hypothetical protein
VAAVKDVDYAASMAELAAARFETTTSALPSITISGVYAKSRNRLTYCAWRVSAASHENGSFQPGWFRVCDVKCQRQHVGAHVAQFRQIAVRAGMTNRLAK